MYGGKGKDNLFQGSYAGGTKSMWGTKRVKTRPEGSIGFQATLTAFLSVFARPRQPHLKRASSPLSPSLLARIATRRCQDLQTVQPIRSPFFTKWRFVPVECACIEVSGAQQLPWKRRGGGPQKPTKKKAHLLAVCPPRAALIFQRLQVVGGPWVLCARIEGWGDWSYGECT